jgi:hypothetical protein
VRAKQPRGVIEAEALGPARAPLPELLAQR